MGPTGVSDKPNDPRHEAGGFIGEMGPTGLATNRTIPGTRPGDSNGREGPTHYSISLMLKTSPSSMRHTLSQVFLSMLKRIECTDPSQKTHCIAAWAEPKNNPQPA